MTQYLTGETMLKMMANGVMRAIVQYLGPTDDIPISRRCSSVHFFCIRVDENHSKRLYHLEFENEEPQQNIRETFSFRIKAVGRNITHLEKLLGEWKKENPEWLTPRPEAAIEMSADGKVLEIPATRDDLMLQYANLRGYLAGSIFEHHDHADLIEKFFLWLDHFMTKNQPDFAATQAAQA